MGILTYMIKIANTKGYINEAVDISFDNIVLDNVNSDNDKQVTIPNENEANKTEKERGTWGNKLEFLMSNIALAVGLGNVWRFSFVAYNNGGGAFLIPYIIVVVFIMRPLYYMEMVMGQFSSRSIAKIYEELIPGFVGVGYGQVYTTFCVVSYYAVLMSLTISYFISSFSSILPWAYCDESWKDDNNCYDATPRNGSAFSNSTNRSSSSELYFFKTILHEQPNIDEGIGYPDFYLTGLLFLSWSIVFVLVIKGIKSSGKVSYFFAMFPYVVMFVLFGRAITLPGSVDGIIYFFQPQWDKILLPSVWYAAVTQAYFSLSVCNGTIPMFASFNKFNHNVNRDALIVSVMDTMTSILAGATIFGILGNLAYVSEIDIRQVVRGGTGLAFISYPDAIAKFVYLPQVFSAIFFIMLFTLAIGSLVALVNNIIAVLGDQFTSVNTWKIAAFVCLLCFSVGLSYVTPGGQFILTLVDHFGAMFAIFILSIFQACGVFWIYGLDNFCNDLEFMMKSKIGPYWRICWGIITPCGLIFILIYSFISMDELKYNGTAYPEIALKCGWGLLIFGVIQVPIWFIWQFFKMRGYRNIGVLFQVTSQWGPKDEEARKQWLEYKAQIEKDTKNCGETSGRRWKRVLWGS